jgi:putative transposase
MSSSYNFANPDGMYFITFSTVEWVDTLSRQVYKDIIVKSMNHCVKEKGLIIYSWVIMTNHVHIIIAKADTFSMSEIMRDFKKYTSNKILTEIELNPQESRKRWMLWLFKSAGEKNPRNTNFQFWQQDNHPEELFSNKFMNQKLDYIHLNPVRAGIVEEPHHYLYSNARDYAGGRGLVKISFIE